MRFQNNRFGGGRAWALGLVAVTVAVPVLLGTLFHVRPDALVPLSLALPFASMGVLDALLNRGPEQHANGRLTH